MGKRDNDFIEQRLWSLINNIHLFNSKMEPFDTSRSTLKKAIKTDTEILGKHYEFEFKVAMLTIGIRINNEAKDISCIFGANLHSQLTIQGLGNVLHHFPNYSLDIKTLNVLDEKGDIILNNKGYVPMEYVYVPAFDTSVNGISITSVEIDSKIYTIYLARRKFLYVDIKEKENV